jgi:hypothetical protein
MHPLQVITIGVYGFDEASYFQALADAKVDTFCDIRLRRGVRGSQYAFVNSTRLQQKLQELNIRYIHILDLAPSIETRAKQKQADTESNVTKRQRTGLSDSFISAYQEQCLKNFDSRTFIRSLGDASVVALFCVEKDPQACHRSLVAQRLEADLGVIVKHILP